MKAFEQTSLYFNRAADHLELNARMRKLLLTSKREVRVQVAVEMDNGDLETLIGFRVQHYKWDLNRVRQELDRILSQAFEHVWQEATERKISLRTAAYIIAIGRVYHAAKLAGV